MPDAARNSARKPTLAKQTVEFCAAVSRASLPVQVDMAFLFDSDEKKESLKAEIHTAAHGKAHFLPVRELENLFLCPQAIHADLLVQCEQLRLPAPTLEQVQEAVA